MILVMYNIMFTASDLGF